MADGSDGYTANSAEGPVSMRQGNFDPACPTRVVPPCRREGSTVSTLCDPAAQYFAWRCGGVGRPAETHARKRATVTSYASIAKLLPRTFATIGDAPFAHVAFGVEVHSVDAPM